MKTMRSREGNEAATIETARSMIELFDRDLATNTELDVANARPKVKLRVTRIGNFTRGFKNIIRNGSTRI